MKTLPLLFHDEWRYLNLRAHSLSDRNGKLIGHIVIWRDITERRKAEEARQRARDEMFVLLRALYGAASRAQGVDDFLAAAIYQIVYTFQSQACVIFIQAKSLTESEADRLLLAAHHGLSAEAVNSMSSISLSSIPQENNAIEWVWEHHEPLLIKDIHSDPSVPEIMKQKGHLSLLIIPMVIDGQILGLIGLTRKKKLTYRTEEIARLTVLAEEIATFVHSDRRRQLATILAERQRLVRDLHDSVTQKLYGLVTLTEVGQAGLDTGSETKLDVTSAQIFSRIGEYARQVLKEMRLFLFELQPVNLERDGLVSILTHRLAAVEGRADIKARLLADKNISLSLEKEVALYFIAQEALNNVLKHASAKSVTIHLKQRKNNVILIGHNLRPYRLDILRPIGYVWGMANQRKPRNPDHVRRVNMPGPQDETIQAQFEALLSPAIYAQAAYYRSLKLRDRILNLPLMIAAILALLWRQIPSVCELTKTLNREGVLWMRPVKVSQTALSKRLLTFPAELFQQVLFSLLPKLRERWQARQRPLPESVVWALQTFGHIYVVDGSTLEALFCKLDALKNTLAGALAGKICTVIDLATRLPEQIWYTAEALAHDTNFQSKILTMVHAGTLWIFDRGFYDFTFFDDLIEHCGHFITRLKSNAVFKVQTVLCHTAEVRDRLITLGGENGACVHTLRLIEVHFGSQWYRYLTSVLDPNVLPANIVADLYRRRWRIEEAFLTVKRLLNLAYLWTGSLNGILLQVWATWLFFALLVDLGDAVAEELMLPFDRISLEMVFRGLYHFTQAHHRGVATDPIKYLAAPENRDLGVVKRIRKKPPSATQNLPATILSPANA